MFCGILLFIFSILCNSKILKFVENVNIKKKNVNNNNNMKKLVDKKNKIVVL